MLLLVALDEYYVVSVGYWFCGAGALGRIINRINQLDTAPVISCDELLFVRGQDTGGLTE